MKVKVENEKVGLTLNIQKTKIMASSPITSWQIDGEAVETVTDFIFLSSKITVDSDSMKLKDACSLDVGWFLSSTTRVLGRGVAPLSRHNK